MSHVDQENLKKIANDLAEAVAEHATKAAEMANKFAGVAGEKAGELTIKAAELSKTGYEAAGPYVVKAAEKAEVQGHKLVKAAEAHGAKLADYSREAAERGKEVSLEKMAFLAAAGAEALSEVEKHAKQAQKQQAQQKRHSRAGRVIGWSAAAAGVASVSYLLWRRSRPIEDPWADEYWADRELELEGVDVPVEVAEVVESAEDVIDDVKDKAEEVAEEVSDKVEEALEEATGDK